MNKFFPILLAIAIFIFTIFIFNNYPFPKYYETYQNKNQDINQSPQFNRYLIR